ncbi:hypothetical protein PHYSODRAFT_563538 [Phytophthora sojae]|uniref:FYVE-type domain-containing protein n=1 Tax=Phytophthora sojae (strain P6497) TaxID=1094619 RepID=G5A0W1_PHYSP|nr:hypothetical protein PHYSODRAFT_563538 [Phytophthora sojae]EGZ10593.1 hypothetical protein PHYSODRAFT_563538 [Phytophthora sojae]|eukprot:XP_009533338.1 hypothetical protein PHYSODRAFT_563538 [Phytophthora sojae]
MRFDGMRTRSASARPTNATAADARTQRARSTMPRGSMPVPPALTTRNLSRPAAPPSVASSASRAAEPLLPPVDELFPRPDLEPRMKKHLVRVANETSNALIKDTLLQDEPGSVLWRPASRPRGAPGNIHVLRGAARDVSEAKDATCVRAVSDDVHASIEEFALLFKLDSSREAADHLLLFNADLVQHATLYTLVSPSGQQPRRYVGVKWALVASPSRFFRNRDFCYLECQKEFTDAKGRRGWVRSLHSLKMPCCPSLEKGHGIVRASIYRSGLTAVETDEPGVLSVTYTQRLSTSPLLGDLDIPARKRTRGSCNLCYREFVGAGGLRDTLASITNLSTRSKRYVCRKCGEGVCRRCSDDWWLDVPVVGRTKVRICTVCSAEAKQSHISAHTTRAGTYPIRGNKEPTTEVEGVTHPGLLSPPQMVRRRSLSMLDRPSDAASFFAQQEEIKRDLEVRATELSRRVQIWDEMQMYERDSSLIPSQQEEAKKKYLREQRRRELEPREQEKEQQHLSRIPSSRLVEQEEEKEEPEAELEPQRQPAGSISTSESEQPEHQLPHDRYPSFMSSEQSSNQEASDIEGDDVIRLTAETGARLSSDYRDSDLTDYEEHTIDGLGEIRTTTDLTRWWQDQQRVSETGDHQPRRQQPQASLSPVQSPRKDKRRASNDDVKMQQQQRSALASAAVPGNRNAKQQEMVDLFNHWKQESTNEIQVQHQRQNHTPEQRQQMQEFEEQARYQEEQVRRRQQSDFEEMAQYQEEQARRRKQSLDSPIRRSQSVSQSQPNTSVLQQIQQRQKELENLRRHRQKPRDDEPPVPSVTSSDRLSAIIAQSSMAAKERYLQQQRQQQLDHEAEAARKKEARLRANKALDQTAGEDVELMETSKGEWVPASEPRASNVASVVSSPRHGPGFCDHCGSPEYMGQNGNVKPSCKCATTPTKATGTVLFDGKWISSPTPQDSP